MKDPITVLEAAYSLDGDERQWLTGLVDAARPNLDDGGGVCGWTYDASGPDLHEVRACVGSGVDSRFLAVNSQFDSSLPKPVRKMISRVYRTGFVGNLVRAPSVLVGRGLDSELAGHLQRALDALLREWNLADALWMNAQDPTFFGCLLVAPRKKERRTTPREVHQWHCIAAHLATAFRIRRQLAGWSPLAPDPGTPRPEAILDPSGKLEHAAEPAKSDSARSALRRAVLSFDRARGDLRRRDPEEAIAIWHALVAGRWSLIDHIDSDGRRFIVAHRNDARVPDMRGLTLRERQALAYTALGHSNKVIAYELGLSTSTVAGHLARARAKLRLPSRAAMRGTSVPAPAPMTDQPFKIGSTRSSRSERGPGGSRPWRRGPPSGGG